MSNAEVFLLIVVAGTSLSFFAVIVALYIKIYELYGVPNMLVDLKNWVINKFRR